MAKRSWNDALQIFVFYFTDHGVSLSTSGLSVCENCSIITGQYILDEVVCSFCIDGLLVRVLPKNIIKSKWLNVISLVRFQYGDLVILFVHFHDATTSAFFLFLVHRANSHHHLNCLTHRRLINRNNNDRYFPF